MKQMKICKTCGRVISGTERWYHSKSLLCYGHSLRLNDLDEIYNGELSINDYLLLTDTDKEKSRKVKLGELVKFIKNSL